MGVEILATGNEGFRITLGGMRVFIDAFYRPARWVGAAPALRAPDFDEASVILVTHAHGDHFDPQAVVDVARRTGATVVGPRTVTDRLARDLDRAALLEMEPDRCGSVERTVAGLTLRAFRTAHSRDHNSYRIEAGDFCCFHDGDNEDTRPLDASTLGRIDALFIAPWHGSGWVDFIDRLRPQRWFMMHLTEGELDQHEKGTFLSELCDHVPPGLVTLRPGGVYAWESGA